jgi:hypothetical protein
MKKVALMLSVLATINFASCTKNEMAKNFGGTTNLDLPSGQKLITLTWKDDHIWYLTKPMTSTDVAETYTFKEQSSYGIFQGSVIILESK